MFGLLAAFLPVPDVHAQSNGIQLHAEVGIGGRYRPDDWIPITLSVVNGSEGALQGQIQIAPLDTNSNIGQRNAATFARPINLPLGAAPQSLQIDERGLDPGSQDVAVSLVDGMARGEGATEAQITTNSSNSHNTFTGIPIAADDLFLVGLSADPTAIMRLNGQQWGLRHTAGGVTSASQTVAFAPGRYRPPTNAPPTVQTAAASPSDLPDRPTGYDGVDAVVLWPDAPLDALTEAQTDALKAWIMGGGHLIVCGGTDPAHYSDPFFMNLLPALHGQDTVVSGPYGAGMVTVLVHDPTTMPGTPWKAILTNGPSSLLNVAAAQETDDRYYYNGGYGQLSDAVLQAPALDAPDVSVIGLFLIGYVLILVPINYLILKRLDKKEWSWATIPALVFVFAAVTYAVGDAAKGNSVFINRAALLETTSRRSEAGVYAAIGLFSPRYTSYDLTLPDPSASASDPQKPSMRFFSGPSQNDLSTSSPARFVEGPNNTKIQDAAVNMWAMRAFDTQTVTDMGGANNTPHQFTKCRLYLNGSWQPLSDLPPGGSVTVSGIFPLPNGNTPVVGWNQAVPISTPMGGIQPRLQAALGQFISGLGSGNNNGVQYFFNNGSPPAFFQPKTNEAILTCFCSDPTIAGPALEVDGHPVIQNSVTCIIVHIPLH
jgi:uncharacterized membrane protein YhaH (DUF805 family)